MKLLAVLQENLTGKQTRGFLLHFGSLLSHSNKEAKIQSLTDVRSHCLPNLVKMNMLFSLEEPVPPL